MEAAVTFENETNPREYIGDGVYVEFDGYSVFLRTDRELGQHWIALEPMMLVALNRFWHRVHEPESKST